MWYCFTANMKRRHLEFKKTPQWTPKGLGAREGAGRGAESNSVRTIRLAGLRFIYRLFLKLGESALKERNV